MERHVTPNSRLAGMEDATAVALAANENQRTLEAKANSPETASLNDTAEFEIYGDKGREYTYKEEFVDPADGVRKTREVSTLDKPYPGKLAEIRSDRRYGKTEGERNKAADKYEEDVNNLLGDGLELTQAKLVMDLRESDKDALAALAGKFIGEGENPLVAKKRAKDLYAKKDAKRLALIKDEGLMSADEYNAKRTGTDPTTPDTDPGTPADLTDDQVTAIENSAAAVAAVEEARNRYIELAASRRKLGFGLRKDKRNSATEDALNEYNVALERVGALAKESLDLEGLSDDKILARAKITWAQESEALNVEGLQTRQEELANSKFMKGFNNWWTRQTAVQDDGSKARFGRIKKVAVMAAIGTGTTLATGVALGAAGVGFGAILPAAVAWRFAKGQAVARIAKNADASSQAEVHNGSVHAETLDRIDNATSLLDVNALTGLSHDKTKEYVSRNRRRVIGSAALGAAGGVLVTNFDGISGTVGDAKNWLSDKLGNIFDGNDSGSGNGGGASSPDGTPGGAAGGTPEVPADDRVLPGSVTGGVSPEDVLPTPEDMDAVAQALENQTSEILNAEGSFPWDRAVDVYGGNNATPRLMEAVEALKAQGIDAGWTSNPLTSDSASIVINGNTDVNYVWKALAPALAEQDLENFFANAG